MSLKYERKKYDDKFSAKRNMEREISFITDSRKDRYGKIELIQKDTIENKSTSESVMNILEVCLET